MVHSARAAGNAVLSPHSRDHAHTMKPYNLSDAEAVGSGLTPVYGDAESFTVDVESPGGERLSIHDPRLMSMLREGIHEKHELTLLRSDRAMTDCRPISIMSLQTVQQLSNEIGITVDKRQFRANVYVDLESGNGFEEDEFVGRTLRLGRRASIAVLKRDSRCKICTLDFQTTRPNPELMKQLARDHEGQAGIYGAVLIEGLIRAGDEIALQD